MHKERHDLLGSVAVAGLFLLEMGLSEHDRFIMFKMQLRLDEGSGLVVVGVVLCCRVMGCVMLAISTIFIIGN